MTLLNQTTILHVSDTHLSTGFTAGARIWTNLVRYTEMTRPDLYVNKSIGLDSRRRLRSLVKSETVKLIGSGHLHEHVVLFSAGALLVGAPALGPVPRGEESRTLGLRCNGAVEYRFCGDTVRV